MIGSYVHKLTKVTIINAQQYHIVCEEEHYGDFTNTLAVKEFIKKHNNDDNCFFICKVYVLNPTELYQCPTCLYIEVYNHDGELYESNNTFMFNPHPNNIESNERMKFIGRNGKTLLKKNGLCWFYNEYDKRIEKCIIVERPITLSEYSKASKQIKESIEWYDDSYMVKPFDDNGNMTTHTHILTCFMFSNEYIEQFLNNLIWK